MNKLTLLVAGVTALIGGIIEMVSKRLANVFATARSWLLT